MMSLRQAIHRPGRFREDDIEELPAKPKFVHADTPFNPDLRPAVFPTLGWDELGPDHPAYVPPRADCSSGRVADGEEVRERPAKVFRDERMIMKGGINSAEPTEIAPPCIDFGSFPNSVHSHQGYGQNMPDIFVHHDEKPIRCNDGSWMLPKLGLTRRPGGTWFPINEEGAFDPSCRIIEALEGCGDSYEAVGEAEGSVSPVSFDPSNVCYANVGYQVSCKLQKWTDLSDGMRLILVRELTGQLSFNNAILYLELTEEELEAFFDLCKEEIRIREANEMHISSATERQTMAMDDLEWSEEKWQDIFDEEATLAVEMKKPATFTITREEVTNAQKFLGSFKVREQLSNAIPATNHDYDHLPPFAVKKEIHFRLDDYIGCETTFMDLDFGEEFFEFLPVDELVREEVFDDGSNQESAHDIPHQGVQSTIVVGLPAERSPPVRITFRTSNQKSTTMAPTKDNFTGVPIIRPNLIKNPAKRGRPPKLDKIMKIRPSLLREVINAEDITAPNSTRLLPILPTSSRDDTILPPVRNARAVGRSPFKEHSPAVQPSARFSSFRDDIPPQPAPKSPAKSALLRQRTPFSSGAKSSNGCRSAMTQSAVAIVDERDGSFIGVDQDSSSSSEEDSPIKTRSSIPAQATIKHELPSPFMGSLSAQSSTSSRHRRLSESPTPHPMLNSEYLSHGSPLCIAQTGGNMRPGQIKSPRTVPGLIEYKKQGPVTSPVNADSVPSATKLTNLNVYDVSTKSPTPPTPSAASTLDLLAHSAFEEAISSAEGTTSFLPAHLAMHSKSPNSVQSSAMPSSSTQKPFLDLSAPPRPSLGFLEQPFPQDPVIVSAANMAPRSIFALSTDAIGGQAPAQLSSTHSFTSKAEFKALDGLDISAGLGRGRGAARGRGARVIGHGRGRGNESFQTGAQASVRQPEGPPVLESSKPQMGNPLTGNASLAQQTSTGEAAPSTLTLQKSMPNEAPQAISSAQFIAKPVADNPKASREGPSGLENTRLIGIQGSQASPPKASFALAPQNIFSRSVPANFNQVQNSSNAIGAVNYEAIALLALQNPLLSHPSNLPTTRLPPLTFHPDTSATAPANPSPLSLVYQASGSHLPNALPPPIPAVVALKGIGNVSARNAGLSNPIVPQQFTDTSEPIDSQAKQVPDRPATTPTDTSSPPYTRDRPQKLHAVGSFIQTHANISNLPGAENLRKRPHGEELVVVEHVAKKQRVEQQEQQTYLMGSVKGVASTIYEQSISNSDTAGNGDSMFNRGEKSGAFRDMFMAEISSKPHTQHAARRADNSGFSESNHGLTEGVMAETYTPTAIETASRDLVVRASHTEKVLSGRFSGDEQSREMASNSVDNHDIIFGRPVIAAGQLEKEISSLDTLPELSQPCQTSNGDSLTAYASNLSSLAQSLSTKAQPAKEINAVPNVAPSPGTSVNQPPPESNTINHYAEIDAKIVSHDPLNFAENSSSDATVLQSLMVGALVQNNPQCRLPENIQQKISDHPAFEEATPSAVVRLGRGSLSSIEHNNEDAPTSYPLTYALHPSMEISPPEHRNSTIEVQIPPRKKILSKEPEAEIKNGEPPFKKLKTRESTPSAAATRGRRKSMATSVAPASENKSIKEPAPAIKKAAGKKAPAEHKDVPDDRNDPSADLDELSALPESSTKVVAKPKKKKAQPRKIHARRSSVDAASVREEEEADESDAVAEDDMTAPPKAATKVKSGKKVATKSKPNPKSVATLKTAPAKKATVTPNTTPKVKADTTSKTTVATRAKAGAQPKFASIPRVTRAATPATKTQTKPEKAKTAAAMKKSKLADHEDMDA